MLQKLLLEIFTNELLNLVNSSNTSSFYDTLVILMTFIKETLLMSKSLETIDQEILKKFSKIIFQILITFQAPVVLKIASDIA